jgi:hypothetical protein
MAQHHINFADDLPKIRKYFGARFTAAGKSHQPVAAIEIGFRLCQRGLIGMSLDEEASHLADVSHALGDPLLKLPGWSRAYMQAEDHGIAFTLLDGTSKTVKPHAGDLAVASVFGNTLLSVLRDAKARKLFELLHLREDCQLEIMEFDWMWRWPESGLGRTNQVRRLRAVRLPR